MTDLASFALQRRHAGGAGKSVLWASSAGVTVPRNWSGIQNPAYPVRYGGGPVVNRMPFSMSARERNHDLSGLCSQWRQINTAAGVYDATSVARLDTWVNQCVADGVEIIFTIFGTPTFIASTVPDFTDQYGNRYAANTPTDVSSAGCPSIAAFVTWLLGRYNTGGQRRIQYIEAWNEPLFSTAASSYWTGTYVQMAQVMKGVYAAAKAADPGIVVLSPGFAGMSGGLSPMVQNLLTAAVGDGTTGKDWCDGVAYHPYSFGVARYPVIEDMNFKQFMADCAAYAAGKPIYATEVGFLQDWQTLSQIERARIIKQHALVQAAYGVKLIQWYSADYGYTSGAGVSPTYVADNIIGGPLTDQTIREAFTWVQSLGGKTLYEVGYLGGKLMYGITNAGTVTA